MGLLNGVNKICEAIGSPLNILDNWAKEPLKRWENKREQKNKDNDVRREIERATGVAKAESEIRIKEAQENASLQIHMQAEIQRINIESEEWKKDQEFQRLVKATDAFATFQKKLSDLNMKTVRAIGDMDLELRSKAQTLILNKTKEYKALQDLATKDAEDEFTRITEKFGNNERIMNIMIGAAETKLVSVINSTSKFLEELSNDIQKMNQNIDVLVQEGQHLINSQLSSFNSSTAMLGGQTTKQIDDKQKNIE